MAEISLASKEDKQDIIDFINYVFSVAYTAHDFKKKLPKVYADDAKEDAAAHYIIKSEGRIKAAASLREIKVCICGKVLKYGLIGNVAVHPYSRGEGYMTELMGEIIRKAKKDGLDLLALTGQRQRYGYFGFFSAGTALRYTLTDVNVKHALKDTDHSDISFLPLEKASEIQIETAQKLYERRPAYTVREKEEYLSIMSSWENMTNLILQGGRVAGYLYGAFREVVLEDEALLYKVIKAYFDINRPKSVEITVQPFEKRRAELLSEICETRCILPTSLIKVLNRERVSSAFLELKAKSSPLIEGEAVVKTEQEAIKIAVKNGKARVEKAESSAPCIELDEHQAAELFFGLEGLTLPNEMLKNWVPLGFILDPPDTF